MNLVKKLDTRMERQNSGLRQGFQSKGRIVGLPCEKPPPSGVKKWAVNAEALATLATSRMAQATQEDYEDTSELTGLNFDE